MPNPLRLIGTILSALALAVAIAVALATVVVPKVMGATPYTVLTGSMRPHLEPGALAIVAPTDPADIRVGDVVTYQIAPGEPQVITHRVVGVNANTGGDRSFVTQGDANGSPDPEAILPVQIRGTVAYSLPWLGHVNSAINVDTRSGLVVVAAGALISYGLWQMGSGVRSRRREAQQVPAV